MEHGQRGVAQQAVAPGQLGFGVVARGPDEGVRLSTSPVTTASTVLIAPPAARTAIS